MKRFDLCVPCLFGLEALAGSELKRMGMKDVAVETGRVLFSGTVEDIPKANICLATGERVLLRLASFDAYTFDDLFEGVRAIPWEEFIPVNGKFPVKGHSLNSKLFSVPDCQKIIKKAAAERLKSAYRRSWMNETAELYQIQFSIMKDRADIFLDTTGAGLHKRGYRAVSNAAPLRETLAAGMVRLAKYFGKGVFCDPFCGSGTIAIEAAFAALNRAPGLNRGFSAESWGFVEKSLWKNAREEAKSREYKGDYTIWGGDIDPDSIKLARSNAKKAGVDRFIEFEVADAAKFDRAGEALIVTNPPYGERIMEKKEAEILYRNFGAAVLKRTDLKLYILSSHTEFERTFGRTAVKKRKLYNGMIKCDLFMYY